MRSDEEIDWLVGCYGFIPGTHARVSEYLSNLADKCDLSGVNVTCVEREHSPVSSELREQISSMKFGLRTCSVPPQSNTLEDTGLFCDWMVDNVGTAPWVAISHFDIVFLEDYVSHLRELMSSADMIGEHHNGIVLVRRSALLKCRVGFCGVTGLVIMRADVDLQLRPQDAPTANTGRAILAIDVGDMIGLRMCHLGLCHIYLIYKGNVGKSKHFKHTRRGSGHGGRVDNDTNENPPHISVFYPSAVPEPPSKAQPISTLIGADILSDGSGIWLIHLDREGEALCGAEARMRSGEPAAVNCPRCLQIHRESR